jgi:hypothetical protein
MYQLVATLAVRLQDDRGEFGPMAYAVMVSAMVVLALAVAAWGDDLANQFMNQVSGPGGGGGDGGGGAP